METAEVAASVEATASLEAVPTSDEVNSTAVMEDCSSPPPTRFVPYVFVSGTHIRAKELILVLLALTLLVFSVLLFFRHWKKNYWDINQLPYYSYLYKKGESGSFSLPPPVLPPPSMNWSKTIGGPDGMKTTDTDEDLISEAGSRHSRTTSLRNPSNRKSFDMARRKPRPDTDSFHRYHRRHQSLRHHFPPRPSGARFADPNFVRLQSDQRRLQTRAKSDAYVRFKQCSAKIGRNLSATFPGSSMDEELEAAERSEENQSSVEQPEEIEEEEEKSSTPPSTRTPDTTVSCHANEIHMAQLDHAVNTECSTPISEEDSVAIPMTEEDGEGARRSRVTTV